MSEIVGVTAIQANIPKQQVDVAPASHLPPQTTLEENLTTESQRNINRIWEYTQSLISASVVLSCMIVGVYDGVTPACGTLGAGMCHPEFPMVLSSSLFLIVGFYFSRTNHAAIGGIGKKPEEPYAGR